MAKAKAAPAPAQLTLGQKIDAMFDLREKKRALEAQVKELDGQYADLESQLMEDMASQGTDKLSGTKASVSITTTVAAQVEDWDSFLAYVYKMKYGHLLQRRVSDPAYRELLEQGKKVPGVQPFSKNRLNLRVR
jgi:hypothetical protein